MSAITSTANGTYTDCGLGQGVGLALTCGGSSCGILSQFPHLQCSNDPVSSLTSCNNNVQCPGQTNFKSLFMMQQHQDNTVSVQQQLQVDGQSFSGTDDGHGVVAYSGASGTSNPGPGPSVTETTGVSGATGANTGSSTSGGAGTKSSSVSAASSAPSLRKPPFSKALFVLFVALGMFIGQSSADSTSFRLKGIAINTGVSLLWMLVLAAPWTQAQLCTTVGDFPQITPELSAFTSNGHLTVIGTYSVVNPGSPYCSNVTLFTATQTVIDIQGPQTFIAPAAVIKVLPTTITHAFPTVAPAGLPALGSIFELTGVWTGPFGFTGGGALFVTLAPRVIAPLPTCSITGQIPGLTAFFSPVTGPATVSFIETYAKAGTASCSTEVPFTIYQSLIGKASTFTAPLVVVTAVPVVFTHGFSGLAHSMLATLGPILTRSAVWRNSSGASIGGGSDFIILPAAPITTSGPPPVTTTPPPFTISPVISSSKPPTVTSVSIVTPPPQTTSKPPTSVPTPTPTPTPTTNPNAQIISDINNLFPSGNSALLSQVESSLCQSAVLPAISSVVSGQITRASGVVNLVQACLQFIDAAEPKAGAAETIFEFALGNIVLCDKLSNTILSGNLVVGRSGVCNAIVPAIPA